MRLLKGIGKWLWRFMVIFSFIVNIILVIVLIALGLLIFEIKQQIAQPLVGGLHSSFVGLDQATIDWTIPVRDTIPVKLTIPLETETMVELTAPVPLVVTARIDLPGVGTLNNAQVNLSLPQGLQLPVKLDLDVEVDEPLDISLDVRAVIPLSQTQLHDPFENLRLLFEPLARGLYNLPDDFNQAGAFAGDLLGGQPINLLAENDYSRNPWPGFSRTAGMHYSLFNEPFPVFNIPAETGIVALGGIPLLDEQLRPEIYAQGGPAAVNEAAYQNMNAQGVPSEFYDGGTLEYLRSLQPQTELTGQAVGPTGGPVTSVTGPDLGIMPTPGAP